MFPQSTAPPSHKVTDRLVLAGIHGPAKGGCLSAGLGKRAGEKGAEKGDCFFLILRSHKVRRGLRMRNGFLFLLTTDKS